MDVQERHPVIPLFFAGREVFITGATGFMGKVLVERLLATCPDIGILHLLMRTKKDITPESRLRELKKSQVFDVLRRTSPGQLDKLRVVCGDITKPSLGLSDRSRSELENVSVVFNSAATVKLKEELSLAMETNVLSVMRLLDLCDQLPKLAACVHVSTAYCHAERAVVEERVYPPPRPLQQIIEDAQRSHMTPSDTKKFIWPKPNTYTFTKMLAEYAVFEHEHKGYACAIFRPTIVISSLRRPFAGWVERHSGPCGVAATASSGALRVLRCEGAARADLLPVDLAADALIAASWETAVDQLSSVRVYNYSTGENRPEWEALRRNIEAGARTAPSVRALWYPRFMFARSRFTYKILEFFYQTLPLHLAEFFKLCFCKNTNSMNLIQLSQRLSAMSDALEYFTTHEFEFPADNLRRLRARLSERDRALYNLDPSTIEWEDALKNFVLGVRRHVLMEKDDTIPAARKRLRRLYILHQVLTILVPVLMSMYLIRRRREYSLLRSITNIAIWFHRTLQNMIPSVPW